jgi:hypothetical protein
MLKSKAAQPTVKIKAIWAGILEKRGLWHNNRMIILLIARPIFRHFGFLHTQSLFFPLFVVLLIC